MSNEYPGIIIIGPTASGKSGLGISLAARFNGEIVSCDALQLYRRMDIGTAKVTAAQRQEVRHHMLDLLDPSEDFSAGMYQGLARKALDEIRERRCIPFVVGGTGFYLKALLEGLFEGPGRDETIRKRMWKIINHKGPQILHRALKRIDPLSAERIEEADSERIIRAYEMYLVSGQPMSWWQQQPRNELRGYRWLKIGIDLPRMVLYKNIDTRVDEMFRNGFEEEVQELLNLFSRNSPAFKAIGYRQVAEYFEGKHTLEAAIEDTKKESRHYAKRQMTWFRRDPDIRWITDRGETGHLEADAGVIVKEFLHKD